MGAPFTLPEPATLDDVRREMEALIAGPGVVLPRFGERKSVTLPDTPDAIRRDLDALVAGSNHREIPGSCPAEILHPETANAAFHGNQHKGGVRQIGEDQNSRFTADTAEPASALAARTLHLRRQLAAAVDHGTDVLAALGLPRLVEGEFIAIDPTAVGDAIEAAVAALDALDGDADLEDEGEAEPSLGWVTSPAGVVFPGDTLDLELDTADWEPSLGAPEHHPSPGWGFGRAYVSRGPEDSQARWAQGAQHDGEAVNEDGDDLDAGEHDTADLEPSIGRPEDPAAVLSDVLHADHDPEADDADLEHDERHGRDVWVFGPSRREVAHA